jgi:hypothetical protein
MGPIARRFRRVGPRPFAALASISSTPSRGGGAIAIQPPSSLSSSSFHITDISIPCYVDHRGVVCYQIHVFAFGNLEWTISHRYSEFYALYQNVSYWMTFPTTAQFPQKVYSSWMVSMTDEELTTRLVELKAIISLFLD